MKNKLKTINKIAMFWTFPIMIFVFAFMSLATVLLYLLVSFLNISGTIGASLYLFELVKLKIIDNRLRRLIRKDEKLYKFESDNLKKNEDSSSAVN